MFDRMRTIEGGLLIGGLVLLWGCGGGGEQASKSDLAAGGPQLPEGLYIAPLQAHGYHELHAEGLDPLDFDGTTKAAYRERLVWSIGGVEVGRGRRLDSQHTRRGNVVTLTRLDAEGEVAESYETTIANAAPKLTAATLSRMRDNGAILQCRVGARDPDDDTLSYRYEWRIDGQRFAGALNEFAPLDEVTKGQVLECIVVASDGELESDPLTTRPYEIDNLPPKIEAAASALVRTAPDGTKTVSFSLRASDPDGDALDIRFSGAPSGHEWNPEEGMLRWTTSERITPRTIRVSVSDGKGATVEHDLVLQGEPEDARGR